MRPRWAVHTGAMHRRSEPRPATASIAVRTAIRCLLLLWLAAAACAAAAQELASSLREEVLMVTKPGAFALDLETTLFRPPGDGPHPLVIINHGKAAGNPRFQSRARYLPAVREFVRRGYAVVIPMRQGFSKSTGSYIGGGCNVASNGLVQAEDVKLVLEQFAARADIDATRVVVLGQSHGGLTTLALGACLANVVGLVNFAGGLRNDGCTAWEQTLARAVGSYGKDTAVPSLWFYGDNDSYFQPWLWRDMHARYTEAGGRARLVAFGNFGSDSHAMFGSREGLPVWLPEVEKFFRELGLPFEAKHVFAPPAEMPAAHRLYAAQGSALRPKE